MRVHIELYASLMKYLPAGSGRHRATVEMAEKATPLDLLQRFQVPLEQAHLVVVNGLYSSPEDRAARFLDEGDVVAVWPPVAGG